MAEEMKTDEDLKNENNDDGKEPESATTPPPKKGSASQKTSAPSQPGSAKSGSKSSSKPGSGKSAGGLTARSAAASGRSPKPGSRNSARSTSPIAKPKMKAKKKVTHDDKSPEDGNGDADEGLPEGVIPIFLASMTQEIFECRADTDVTEDEPLKMIKKEDILKDLFNRAAVSDFHPVKPIIVDYPEEELLIGYDPDFKYGQNFFIATTEEAKLKLLRFICGEEEEGVEQVVEEAEEVVYEYVPPIPKDWISLGSERDIEEESLIENRKRAKMSVKRMRRDFGVPVNFTDRNVGDAKDAFVECVSYEDKSFELKRMELTKCIQAIPGTSEISTQTDWRYPRNAAIQYEPRMFNKDQSQEIEALPEYTDFLQTVAPRFDLALQQNEIMNVFYDDWMALADQDSSFGSKADNHLKEYQSFTDLQFSKDKSITCIDWHPTVRGVVAVSVGERLNFDDRIEQAARVIMAPSLILIWSFTDPIHPQLLLEAPDDLQCFKFSPTDPNIVAGGCINGQVVLWDITKYAERLKAPRGGKKKSANTLPGFEDENLLDTPIVRYCAVSSIEHSHRSGVTDIQWLPDHLELTRMGVPQENRSGQCVQIMTCAVDHASNMHSIIPTKERERRRAQVRRANLAKKREREQRGQEYQADEIDSDEEAALFSEEESLARIPGTVLVWDIRPPKSAAQQHGKQKDDINNPMGVSNTFKHLDLTWKPHLKVTLSKSEPGGDHAPTRFSIAERQGDKSSLNEEEDDKLEKKDSTGFSFGNAKPGSAHKRTLKTVQTHFFVGTEDGEIVYVDWMPQKDQDSGKIQTQKPSFYHTLHDGPVVTVQRSPFIKGIILCVGGWSFSIWKEGLTSGPILLSCPSSKRLTAGHWSPSRPAVFYITKQDGSVDIWDLLDRTHEPSMNQNVTPSPITCIFPFAITNKQHLLAVGDNSGTLHILEIPWSLRQPTPNELLGTSNYFDREIKRRGFVMARWDFREKEKMEMESELKRKAGIAPNVVLTDEEVQYRMKQEYQQFTDEESSFLRELGLKEEVEEPLPQID